ncbi:unnamed protein product [Prorocentrum cordatum]|uniref:DNA (cytosine-5-)-methyltransferase n=1 Tax=Prorocentrum cordatum TaxID=2364126 RepID=A0ABN9WCI5_9DINO|nr:unnamed protein product [Polarella glacialis]
MAPPRRRVPDTPVEDDWETAAMDILKPESRGEILKVWLPCCGLCTGLMVLKKLNMEVEEMSFDIDKHVENQVIFEHGSSDGVFIGPTSGNICSYHPDQLHDIDVAICTPPCPDSAGTIDWDDPHCCALCMVLANIKFATKKISNFCAFVIELKPELCEFQDDSDPPLEEIMRWLTDNVAGGWSLWCDKFFETQGPLTRASEVTIEKPRMREFLNESEAPHWMNPRRQELTEETLRKEKNLQVYKAALEAISHDMPNLWLLGIQPRGHNYDRFLTPEERCSLMGYDLNVRTRVEKESEVRLLSDDTALNQLGLLGADGELAKYVILPLITVFPICLTVIIITQRFHMPEDGQDLDRPPGKLVHTGIVIIGFNRSRPQRASAELARVFGSIATTKEQAIQQCVGNKDLGFTSWGSRLNQDIGYPQLQRATDSGSSNGRTASPDGSGSGREDDIRARTVAADFAGPEWTDGDATNDDREVQCNERVREALEIIASGMRGSSEAISAPPGLPVPAQLGADPAAVSREETQTAKKTLSQKVAEMKARQRSLADAPAAEDEVTRVRPVPVQLLSVRQRAIEAFEAAERAAKQTDAPARPARPELLSSEPPAPAPPTAGAEAALGRHPSARRREGAPPRSILSRAPDAPLEPPGDGGLPPLQDNGIEMDDA